MFPRRELNTALEYVRQRSVITGDDDDAAERPTIYTTGVGCTQHGRLIAGAFNVKYVDVTVVVIVVVVVQIRSDILFAKIK